MQAKDIDIDCPTAVTMSVQVVLSFLNGVN